MKKLPYELSGDRHKAEYDPVSDKVLVSFRQMIPARRSAIDKHTAVSNGWYARQE